MGWPIGRSVGRPAMIFQAPYAFIPYQCLSWAILHECKKHPCDAIRRATLILSFSGNWLFGLWHAVQSSKQLFFQTTLHCVCSHPSLLFLHLDARHRIDPITGPVKTLNRKMWTILFENERLTRLEERFSDASTKEGNWRPSFISAAFRSCAALFHCRWMRFVIHQSVYGCRSHLRAEPILANLDCFLLE